MTITLKQMRYALAVAEQAHFGRAATSCHVTQPALSQQIRLLEEDCGTRLFDRTGKTIRPTPFGEEFLTRTKSIVSDTNALMAFASGHNGKPSRPIRFGLIPTVAPYLLPTIYPALQQGLPDIAFTISERRTEQLLQALETGKIDIALIATKAPKEARLTQVPLFTDPFVLATSQSSNLPDPTNLNDVPKEHILLLDEGHCFRDQAIEACSLRDDEAGNTFAATSLSTIMEFVANGQGVTLLPEIALKKEAADPRIKISALAPKAGRELSLVWREATPFAEVFKEIVGVIKELEKPLKTKQRLV